MFEVRIHVKDVNGKNILARSENGEKVLVPLKAFRGLHRTMWGEVVIGKRKPISSIIEDTSIFRIPEKGEVLIAYICWVNDLCFAYGWNFATAYDDAVDPFMVKGKIIPLSA